MNSANWHARISVAALCAMAAMAAADRPDMVNGYIAALPGARPFIKRLLDRFYRRLVAPTACSRETP